MVRSTWRWLGVAVVVGNACQPTLDGPIDYRVTGGWGGRGPAIHVEMSGTATTFHRCGATMTMQLDEWVLADLRRKMSNADLSTLEPHYRLCVDCDREAVSAQLGGRVYTVDVRRGSPHVPSRLRAVLDTLRSLAGDVAGEGFECSPAERGLRQVGAFLPPPAPPAPPAPPHNIAPDALEANRFAGENHIVPDDDTEIQIVRSGKQKLIGSYKLCLTAEGNIVTLTPFKSTGFSAYDSKIQNTIRSEWRYRPFIVNGKPVPVCAAVTLIYSPVRYRQRTPDSA